MQRTSRYIHMLAIGMLGIASCGKGPDVPSGGCPGNVCVINPGSPAPVYPPLSATISSASPVASSAAAYSGMAYNFFGIGSGGTDSYVGGTWSWGDGTTGSGEGTNVTHTYTTAGTYTVTFTVKDSAGYTATATLTVTATPAIETALYSFTNELWANSLIAGVDGNLYGTTQTGGEGSGSVFKITPTGALTTLYNLNIADSADGCTPEGLTEGADGNLYGTTYTCGTYGTGNVFVISPGGAETVLHAFSSNNTDGANPKSGLIQAANGNFYGATANGGSYGLGTVFMITTTGVETVLYSFGASSVDGASPENLVLGTDGNIYGITTNGGSHGEGAVFEVEPSGVEAILYSFGASTTDGASPNSLLQGLVDGNFYGTTFSGGDHGHGSVFKLTPAGVETILYSFGASTTDGESPSDLIQTSDGNLYGTTYSGGNFGGGAVFELTPAGTLTTLFASFGALDLGSSCSGGAFNPPNGANPLGITLGLDGVFYGFTAGGECSGTIPLNGAIFSFAP